MHFCLSINLIFLIKRVDAIPDGLDSNIFKLSLLRCPPIPLAIRKLFKGVMKIKSKKIKFILFFFISEFKVNWMIPSMKLFILCRWLCGAITSLWGKEGASGSFFVGWKLVSFGPRNISCWKTSWYQFHVQKGIHRVDEFVRQTQLMISCERKIMRSIYKWRK